MADSQNRKLPKGWRMVRFDELAQMVNERVDPSATDAEIYVGLEHLDSESLKIRRWGTPDDVIGQKLGFRKGDIIFGRRRAYQRKLAVAEFDGICSAHAMVLSAKSETVDPEFLPFLMQSDLFMQRAIDISVGSLSPTINWKTLRIQEFPLPPKDEQRRIAEILRAVDEAVESHRRIEIDFDTVRLRVIDTLVEKMCNASDGLLTLNDISKITDCKHRTPTLLDKGFPMVAPGDISWGPLSLDKCKQISKVDCEQLMDHVQVQPWDLVFSRNQTFGIAAHVQPKQVFAIGQDTVLIQAGSVGTKSIYMLLRSSFVQKQIQQLAMGSTFKRINLGQIRSLRVPRVQPKHARVAGILTDRLEQATQFLAENKRSLDELRKTVSRQILRCQK